MLWRREKLSESKKLVFFSLVCYTEGRERERGKIRRQVLKSLPSSRYICTHWDADDEYCIAGKFNGSKPRSMGTAVLLANLTASSIPSSMGTAVLLANLTASSKPSSMGTAVLLANLTASSKPRIAWGQLNCWQI